MTDAPAPADHPFTGDQILVTEGLITLYWLDTTQLGGQMFYFTSATDADTDIYWGGQLYSPLPMQADGFEMTTKGAFPQPNISISNIFGAGNLLLDSYRGLIGADLYRILTLRRFLDDGATPNYMAYISLDRFVVAQKTSHNATTIVFKLATRMDQEGTQLPRRQILRDVCSHVYRVWNPAGFFDYTHATCPYTGGAYFDVNDRGTGAQNDQCSRTFNGCTLRFGRFGVLPARFFPGVGKVK
jgi:lambda family phage minor tail protein L